MAENLDDQELHNLFHRHLPPQPMPPELAARVRRAVLVEAAKLRAAPALQLSADFGDQADQAVQQIFRSHLPQRPLPTDLAARLQREVLAEAAKLRATPLPQASLAVEVRPADNPVRPKPLARPTIWSNFLATLAERFRLVPSLALTAAAVVLLVLLLRLDPGMLQTSPSTGAQPPFALSTIGDDAPTATVTFTVTPTVDVAAQVIPPITDATPTATVAVAEASNATLPTTSTSNTETPEGSQASPTDLASLPTASVSSTPLVANATLAATPTATAMTTAGATQAATVSATATNPGSQNAGATAPPPTATPLDLAYPGAETSTPTPTRTPNNGLPPSNTPTVTPTPPVGAGPTSTPTPTSKDAGGASGTAAPTDEQTPAATSAIGVLTGTPAQTATDQPTVFATNAPVVVATGTMPTSSKTSTPTALLTLASPKPPTATPIPASPQPLETATRLLPTLAPTLMPAPTNTPLLPTATDRPTATGVSATATRTPTNTPVRPTATRTPTNTPVPPTATDTPTDTAVLPTATRTPMNTPVPPTATDTPTDTAMPPTATWTPTNTPVLPTATDTSAPTDTPTPVPPTATDTPTATAVPPTATDTPTPTDTPTATPVPPTATNTPIPTDTPTNSPPTAGADDGITIEEASLVINVLANDSDPEGLPLTIVMVSKPANGNVTRLDDGSVLYIPDTNYYGSDSFQYVITDGQERAEATVTILVLAVNDPPTFSTPTGPLPDATVGVTYEAQVAASDVESYNLSIAPAPLEPWPSWLVLTDLGNGVARLTGSPPSTDVGTVNLVLVVDDQEGASTPQRFDLTVLAGDTAPP